MMSKMSKRWVNNQDETRKQAPSCSYQAAGSRAGHRGRCIYSAWNQSTTISVVSNVSLAPGQVGATKYMKRRSSWVRNMTTEVPCVGYTNNKWHTYSDPIYWKKKKKMKGQIKPLAHNRICGYLLTWRSHPANINNTLFTLHCCQT